MARSYSRAGLNHYFNSNHCALTLAVTPEVTPCAKIGSGNVVQTYCCFLSLFLLVQDGFQEI